MFEIQNSQSTAQKMKFSFKDFFSKCDQIRSFLRIWSHLPKKSLMENFSYFTVITIFDKLDSYNQNPFVDIIFKLIITRKNYSKLFIWLSWSNRIINIIEFIHKGYTNIVIVSAA